MRWRRQLEPADRVADHAPEIVRIKARFGEIILRPLFQREVCDRLIVRARQHDNRGPWRDRIGNELLQNREPVHVGQAAAEQNAVGVDPPGSLYAIGAICCLADGEPSVHQRHPNRLAVLGAIVDDEDTERTHEFLLTSNDLHGR